MNKKLPLLLIFAFLLFVPMVSAIGITYEKNELGVNDMRVKVSDTTFFGLIKTTELGSFELKSHKTPTEIIDVSPGWDVTMKYELNFNELISYGLGDVYFIDLRTGKEVEREYKFVYWGTEERSREVCIEETQVKSLNSTNVTSECIKYGTETYTYEGWLDYTSKDIPKGKITLGLMVNNKVNDYIDGIWEVAGKKLTKHAGWTASLDNGLISWYSLDETTGTTAFDSLGRNNGTNNGATINQAGKVNRSYSFDGSNDYVYTGLTSNLNVFSVSVWFNSDTVSGNKDILGKDVDTQRGWVVRTKNNVLSFEASGTSDAELIGGTTLSAGIWYLATIISNGTEVRMYLNGNLEANYTKTLPNNNGAQLSIGRRDYPSFEEYYNGVIDEVAIWNRTLTTDEIALLYNDGDGLGYREGFVAVTSLSPIDNFNSSSKDITFIGNTALESVTNFSLIIDDVYEQTNTSGLSGNYTFSQTLDEGVYSWKFESCTASQCINSTARTLTVDTTPFIQFVSPTPLNNSNLSVPYIPVNVTLTEDYFKNVTFNFYKGETLNETITFTDDTRFYNKTGCTCDNWKINVTTCTTTGKCNSTETRFLTIDILAPEINITSPLTNYNYLYVGQTLELNFTATDDNLDSVGFSYYSKDSIDSGIVGGMYYNHTNNNIVEIYSIPLGSGDLGRILQRTEVIPRACFIDGMVNITSNDTDIYCSNVNISLGERVPRASYVIYDILDSATSGEAILQNISMTQYYNKALGMNAPLNTITIYANDTFGNLGSLRQNWDVKTLEQNRIYNLNTIEGSYESYQLNLTKLSTVQIAGAVLHLDGQTQDSQVFVSGNNVRIVNELLINPVEASTNLTLFWTITLSDSSVFNTTTSSQLVENVGIDNCSVNTFPLITFLLKDEELLTPLNGTIESKIEIVNPFSFGVVSTLSSQYTNVNSKSFCTSLNLTNSGFLLNSEIRYSSENHSAEFYNIQRANLSSFPTNVTLYDLKIEDTTKFKIIYQNDKLIGVPGAIIQLQRGYLSEDVFYVVEAPLTSSESTAIVHIDTNTNKYKITVVKDGVVLGTFDNLAFICQSELTGECTLSLFDTLQAPNIIPIETIIDFAYTIDTNSVNRTVEVDFTIPSGTPSPVQVLITQKTIVGTETICNQTIITSAGSVLCEYNQSISDSELTLKIIKGDTLISQTGYVVTDDILGEFGGNNFFLVVLMLLSLTFMAISSPEWIIVNTLITLLVAGAMWLINGMNLVAGLGLIAFLVIAGVILIIKISKQEDL